MSSEQQERLIIFNQALQELMQRYGVTLMARLESEVIETRRGQEQRTIAVILSVPIQDWTSSTGAIEPAN